MKDTNVILYTPGAYGHFINWCCDYFGGNLDSHDIPLNSIGNCHKHAPEKSLWHAPKFKTYTESAEHCNFVQIHESSFDYADRVDLYSGKFIDVLIRNLTYLQENYKKSIYIYPTINSIVWNTNNQIFKFRLSDWFKNNDDAEQYLKDQNIPREEIDVSLLYDGIDRIKKQLDIDSEIFSSVKENFKGWGHQSIYEFDHWELREFASKYYFDKMINDTPINNTIEQELIEKFPNIKFIKMDNLKHNFKYTIRDILEFFNLNITNWKNIDSIHQSWLEKQFYINSDAQTQQIVIALLNKEYLDWIDWNLTFVDELCIQRLLYNNGINIRCWNLNSFPTNTKDFLPLLEETK